MILLGLNPTQKRREIAAFVKKHKIERVYVFYPEAFPLEYPGAKQVEYKEIIMYRTFYPLLEEIDPHSLLVFNEIRRTKNRSDLTYNCAHHYCNQTPHKIVFECFPVINDQNDFMILLDLLDKGRYKGKTFTWEMLTEQDVRAQRVEITPDLLPVEITAKDRERYDKKKKQLFDGLGEKDPDTIPRNLHLVAGDMKKKALQDDVLYVARNARIKKPNVTTYGAATEGETYTVIDFPHRMIDFCDFLKTTGQTSVSFLSTGLRVDQFYWGEFVAWLELLDKFYAKTSLYQRKRS